MNKLIVALIVGAFASVAAAQTAAPLTTKEKQDAVKAATQAGAGSSASAQKTAVQAKENTAVSKETAKLSTADKKAVLKANDKGLVNPNNPTGVAGTAMMQKETTAESKMVGKQNTEIKTKAGQKQLEKQLEKASTK